MIFLLMFLSCMKEFKRFVSKGTLHELVKADSCFNNISGIELASLKQEQHILNEEGYGAIHVVVKSGNLANFRYLLKKDFDVNLRDARGNTALHLAIQTEGRDEFIDLLLASAHLNMPNNEGETPIHLAVIYKNKILTDKLIAKKADLSVVNNAGSNLLHFSHSVEFLNLFLDLFNINAKNKAGDTPLHFKMNRYAYTGNKEYLEMIKLLITKGADINARNALGETILHVIPKVGLQNSLEVLTYLLDNKADVDAQDLEGNTVLHNLINTFFIKNLKQLVDLILERGANPRIKNKKGDTPFASSCALNKRNLSLLSKDRINLPYNAKGQTPLQILIAFSILSDEIEEVIETFKPDLNIRDNEGNTALHIAVMRNNKEMLEKLLKLQAGSEIKNNMGDTALHVAVKNGDLDLLNLMLSLNVNANSKDVNGNDALHLSIMKNEKLKNVRMNLVNSLLKAPNVDINSVNNEGDTALHMAFNLSDLDYSQMDLKIVKALLEKGANVDIQDRNGNLALHLGLKNDFNLHKHEQIIHKLTNLNVTNNKGDTALHIAVMNNNIDAIEFLMKQPNLDVNVRNNNGNTALHLVILSGFGTSYLEYILNEKVDLNIENNDGKNVFQLAKERRMTDSGIPLEGNELLEKLEEFNKKRQLKNESSFAEKA